MILVQLGIIFPTVFNFQLKYTRDKCLVLPVANYGPDLMPVTRAMCDLDKHL